MSLRVPLGVTLETVRKSRRITRQVANLRFRTVAEGGFASCTLSFEAPLLLQPDELDYFADVTVTDLRNGMVAWMGRVEDLGRSAGPDGEIYELTALGPSAHAQDKKLALFYIDSAMDRYEVGAGSTKYTNVSADETPNGDTAIRQQFPRGSGVTNGHKAISHYRLIRDAGLHLARVDGSIWTGFSTATTDWRTRWWAKPSTTLAISVSPGGGNDGARSAVVTTDWPSTDNEITFEWEFTGTTNPTGIGNDNSWTMHYNLSVQQQRRAADGTQLTAASNYTTSYVLAHQVVNDLLGRMLPLYDGVSAASVDQSSTYQIDQLAYPDGVRPAQVLSDLMALVGTHLWEALERRADTGKYQFNWRLWPTTPRYDVTLKDGYSGPGSAAELFNEVQVRWVERNGRVRVVTRTGSVAALSAAGITRTGDADLSQNLGSAAAATKVGDTLVADHATVPNAGSLRISRPVLDRDTQRHVMPWEIRPGYLVRVRGVNTQGVDLLNATRNGVTVFRVMAVDYDQADNTATLELDSYPPQQARQIATLKRQLATRRRR